MSSPIVVMMAFSRSENKGVLSTDALNAENQNAIGVSDRSARGEDS
jgi:hypothetical protein